MFENLVGRFVRVVKKDGFVKWATLTEVKDGLLCLKYPDGREEVIAVHSIESVSDAPSGRRGGQR